MSDPGAVVSSDIAISILRLEHRELEKLFDDYLAGMCRPTRSAVMREICTAVRLHFTVETGIFFPTVGRDSTDPHFLRRVGSEYAEVIGLINELEHTDAAVDADAQVMELRGRLLKHIKDAEVPDGLFDSAARLDMNWDSIATGLVNRRRALVRRGGG